MGETWRMLLFSPRHPSDGSVGVANVVSRLAESWARQGHLVRVAYPARWSPGGDRMWKGVEAVPLASEDPRHVPKGLERSIATAFSRAAHGDEDVCLANNEFGARLPARRTGSGTLGVVALHGLVVRFMELERTQRRGLRPRLGYHADLVAVRGLEREAVRRADLLVAISRSIRQEVIARYGAEAARVHVIYNGADPPPILPPGTKEGARSALGLDPAGAYLAFIGSDPFRKGLDIAQGAVRELRRRGVTVTLLNVGNAEPSSPGTRSLGRVDEATKLHVLQACDVFLLPSRYEGFPAVLPEATAAGLPLVVSARAGLDLGVPGQDHLRLDREDATVWAEAIAGLLDEPERALAMVRAAQRTLVVRSYEDMARDYLALFREALTGPARGNAGPGRVRGGARAAPLPTADRSGR